jgi:hypothetical protein
MLQEIIDTSNSIPRPVILKVTAPAKIHTVGNLLLARIRSQFFDKNGDLLFSDKTRSVVNAVRNACAALKK